MIKAEDIRILNPKEFKYLTMDENGEVFAWRSKPRLRVMEWVVSLDKDVYRLGDIEVEEFQGKDWKECLIEFEPDYSDMIGCVGWFWDDEPDVKTLGVLSEIYMNRYYTNLGTWRFKNFRPAKPDELKFYEE